MRANLRDPLLIQAVIAAAISFAHLHDVADAAGQGGWKAWCYPVSVDLLLVMAWEQIRERNGRPKGAPWTWFLLSMAASLGANVATSGVIDLAHPSPVLRIVVAGWPVLAFFGGSLLVHSRKAQAQDAAGAPQAPAEEPAEEPEEEEEPEPGPAPQTPNLVTYAEAAAVAGVAVETIRGAANPQRGNPPRLTKHQTPDGPRVDLDEVRKRYDLRPVGA
ncbi:DUF2637 domain-containing protein [Streptomyces cinerochromogenes]|uniref:DUF2637 domain-containing protein n=1 Tax=Streptomyces cinerochromogenes TaxID=66422 RepID=A0ABW7BAZ5_9ACTN